MLVGLDEAAIITIPVQTCNNSRSEMRPRVYPRMQLSAPCYSDKPKPATNIATKGSWQETPRKMPAIPWKSSNWRNPRNLVDSTRFVTIKTTTRSTVTWVSIKFHATFIPNVPRVMYPASRKRPVPFTQRIWCNTSGNNQPKTYWTIIMSNEETKWHCNRGTWTQQHVKDAYLLGKTSNLTQVTASTRTAHSISQLTSP